MQLKYRLDSVSVIVLGRVHDRIIKDVNVELNCLDAGKVSWTEEETRLKAYHLIVFQTFRKAISECVQGSSLRITR